MTRSHWDQERHVNKWEEPQFCTRNIGIEEKYGFGVLNEELKQSLSPGFCWISPREISTPQVLGHLAALATLGHGCAAVLVGANFIGVSAGSRLWFPGYPCKYPVRLRRAQLLSSNSAAAIWARASA